MGEASLQAALSEMVAAQVVEVEKLVRRWAKLRAAGDRTSLSEVEIQIREWALRVGRKCLERLVQGIAEESPQRASQCPKCGGPVTAEGKRKADLHSSMGDVAYERRYYACERCHEGAFPLDAELGLDEQRNSPALQQMVSLAGSAGPFEKGSELLREIGSIVISRRKVEKVTEAVGERVDRWMSARQAQAVVGVGVPEGPPVDRLYVEADGTTVPMRIEEKEAKTGKRGGRAAPPADAAKASSPREGGTVQYREVKVGVVFDATVDEEGKPESGAKTYTGTFGDADACIRQVQGEAKARGSDAAKEIVALTDGAEWLWNRLPAAFPGKKFTQILDWCHPAEHLTDLAKLVFGEGTAEASEWAERRRGLLYEGKTRQVIAAIEALRPKTKHAREQTRQTLRYFTTHEHRMNYGELRAQGYFIGSGVIESSCKHIVAARLKQAGMKWRREHVPKILALRVARASGWWERFWKEVPARAVA